MTGDNLIISRSLSQHSQRIHGHTWMLCKLMNKLEQLGYVSSGNFVTDLRDICEVTPGDCHTIDTIENELGG